MCSVSTRQFAVRPQRRGRCLSTRTTSHQGPADKTLHRWMSIYTSNIRSLFAQEEEAQSFVKDHGQCFRSGTIRKRLTEIFQAAGVRLDRRIIKHCYLFREDHVLKQLLIMTHHEVRNVCRTDLHVRRHVVDFSMIKEISDFVRLRTNSARGSQFSRQGDLPFENDSSLGASQDRHAGRGRSLRPEVLLCYGKITC